MRPATPLPPGTKLRWQTLPEPTPEHRPRCRATIIIVNHNGRGHLDQALASLQQDHQPAYEVIVVDNASSDGSAEHIATRYPGVRLIRSGTNLGFGAANNQAARQAKGEYLAFLNPDTKAEAGWLEPLIRALEIYPRAGAPHRLHPVPGSQRQQGLLCGARRGRRRIGRGLCHAPRSFPGIGRL